MRAPDYADEIAWRLVNVLIDDWHLSPTRVGEIASSLAAAAREGYALGLGVNS